MAKKKAAAKTAAATPGAEKAPRKKTAAKKKVTLFSDRDPEGLMEENGLLHDDHDFSTAREITDSRKIDSPVLVSFLVNDYDGKEVVYQCQKTDVPEAAKKALGW